MKNSILIFSKYYEPGTKAGGQLKTVVNLVQSMCGEYNFKIVTQDRDIGDKKSYPDVPIDSWVRRKNSDVYYLSLHNHYIQRIMKILGKKNYSLIYLNSYFSPLFGFIPMLLHKLLHDPRPVLVAPRGEFSPGALVQKILKKHIYRSIVSALGLFDNVYWQASSSVEARQIVEFMKPTVKRIFIAMDFPDITPINICRLESNSTSDDILNIIFISRICPIKNLEFVLQVLASLKIDVVLEIYGPAEDPVYWQKCLRLISVMPDNVKVNYYGHLSPESVPKKMSESDLFFFPTKGENFGYVIWESLSAGTPVLLSDQTPWPKDEDFGSRAFPLSRPDLFAEYIEKYAALDAMGKSTARVAAKKIADSFVDHREIKKATIAMIETATARTSRQPSRL